MAKERKKFSFILQSFVRGILPFATILLYDSLFSGDEQWWKRYKNPIFWVYLVSNLIMNTVIYYTNSNFIDTAMADMNRGRLAMSSLSTMIEPNRFKVSGLEKSFPVVNIFDK